MPMLVFWAFELSMFGSAFTVNRHIGCIFFCLLFFGLMSGLVSGQEGNGLGINHENVYASKTDEELSDLLASWGALSPLERRFLLAETRGRLIRGRNNSNAKLGKTEVRIQRRYGSVIRKSDGSTVVVERKVTQLREGIDRQSGSAMQSRDDLRLGIDGRALVDNKQVREGQKKSEVVRVTYGTGFEKRVIKEESEEKAPKVDAVKSLEYLRETK